MCNPVIGRSAANPEANLALHVPVPVAAAMTLLGDSSILVEDKNSTDAVYRIEADAPVAGITGFRIEALKDASLPMMGPGLQNSNGNFCLTELTVRVGGR